MKKILALLCCCTVLYCTAQQRGYKRISKDFQLTARINPIALFNPFEGAVVAGVEKRISRRTTVGGDAGYIFWSLNTGSFVGTNRLQGFLIRPSIRHYTTDAMHFYVEGVLHFKMVDNKQSDWLGMDCVNEVPSYYKFSDYSIRSTTAGVSMNVGYCENLFKSRRLYLEFYGGLGVRYRTITIANNERACISPNINDSPFDPLRTGKSVLPFVPAGIRLGYVIR